MYSKLKLAKCAVLSIVVGIHLGCVKQRDDKVADMFVDFQGIAQESPLINRSWKLNNNDTNSFLK